MTIGPESSGKTSPGNIASPGPRQVVGAPIEPPPAPATYDFVVSSMNVTKARSGGWLESGDTDYATLAINALAADNTVITQYGPITRKLGDFGNNSSTDPQMSLTDLAVPEGGSLAVSFIVVNKGGWDWDTSAPWKITYNYPGTNSPDGCGDNSEYAATYTVANSVLRVTVPNVIGLSRTAATAALTAAKLIVETTFVEIHTTELPLPKPKVISQYPSAGATAYASSTVVIEVTVPEPPGGHHLPQ
jgi:hypothetical protein